jgi:Protein kinase domain
LLVVAAGLPCLLGIAGYVLLSQSEAWNPSSHTFWVIQLIVLLVAGALLVFAGFEDRRTLLFGATTILNATAFARTGFAYLIDSSEMYSLRYFAALPLEALSPYYFWRFARVFPEAFLRPSLDRMIDWAERVSLTVGLFLIASNIALLLHPQLALLIAFQASDPNSVFPTLLYGLTFPILFVLWLRMRTAREEERRRVQVFTFGLLVTIVPTITAIVLIGISADVYNFLLRDDINRIFFPLMQLFILATPMILTYAVLVERLLPIKILLRQSLRYWLGNGFIILGIVLPLVLVYYYLYNSRTLTIAALFDGYNGLFVATALGLSLTVLSQRQRAQRYLDELFYRASYDANEVLAELALNAQSCTSLSDVAHATQHTLELSLHPQNSHLLFISNYEVLRDPRQELADLPLESMLATALLALQQPLDARDIATASGGAEERWLSQANAAFLIPVKVRAATAGVLIVGNKRSELPYTRADFNFLQLVLNTVTGACHHLLDAWNTQERDRRAMQCSGCGMVSAEAGLCMACGGTQYIEALLPKALHQHYVVTKFIGSGLGAVYLAQDTELQRPVVLKSVAVASAEELHHLRDEARVMATLSHPHIATIYGLESYQGMPILVCEYLQNGTLDDILRDGYLAHEEVMVIIEQVVQALIYLHERGISHSDIKPSNIGFDAEETAKLLDFGVANRPALPIHTEGTITYHGGTYAYMSPEKIQHQKCDQRADLWALAVTLFEAMYGINPFAGTDLPTIIDRVTNAEKTILAAVASPAPFLRFALSNDIVKRPQTAEQFLAMMREATW